MNRRVISIVACVVFALASGLASAQQRVQQQSQRPVAPMPPADELFYRTFTATELAQSDQPVQVNPTAGRGSATMPNTANVIEEIFRRGLGPIVLGVPGQRNDDGTPKPAVFLNNQKDVSALLRSSRSRTPEVTRLQKNLIALKVNMIICGNGITVNDPGDPFRDLSLAPGFSVSRFPIYGSCEECNSMCPPELGVCFMTVELQCRCYLFHLDPMRTANQTPAVAEELALPRRLTDLAAFADNMLTNRRSFSKTDFDAVNQTIEIVNGAFASDLPFGPQDLVQWGGPDGRLVLTSVRPLSEVPFLVNVP